MTNDFKLYQINIFLAIEAYLVEPSQANEAVIKALSKSLVETSLSKTILETNKSLDKIAADEWQPQLLALVDEHALVAKHFSARMYEHLIDETYGEAQSSVIDNTTIFKLSKDEFRQINVIKSKLLSDGVPDGLIFTFGGYLERINSSKSPDYIDSNQAMALNFNAQYLYTARKTAPGSQMNDIKKEVYAIKAFLAKTTEDGESAVETNMIALMKQCLQLEKNGYTSLANKLRQSIHQLQYIRATEEEPQRQMELLHDILQPLANDNDIVHHKQLEAIIINLLIITSVIGLIPLACTAYQRGTFFYQPENEIGHTIDTFQSEVTAKLSAS